MRTLGVLFILLFVNTAMSSEIATYFRVWQGFKKVDLTLDQFLYEIPSFMTETVDLYDGAGALNNYFVIIPPRNRPSFIPDEFALVGLGTEPQYRQIRRTEAGRRYSARHWDVFDRNTSASATQFINYWQENPEELIPTYAYDMVGRNIDWRKGDSFAYVGIRKPGVSVEVFKAKLKQHIEDFSYAFKDSGLKGYIVMSTDNYEVAYLNWSSEEVMNWALNSDIGEIITDTSDFMNDLMFEKAEMFDGSQIEEGKFYRTIRDDSLGGCYSTGDIWWDC